MAVRYIRTMLLLSDEAVAVILIHSLTCGPGLDMQQMAELLLNMPTSHKGVTYYRYPGQSFTLQAMRGLFVCLEKQAVVGRCGHHQARGLLDHRERLLQ